jgi:acyl-coenzyme A thioesterase PaaI-like protein
MPRRAAERALVALAEGTIARRGKSICFCNVAVRNSEGEQVAQARAVYKLG